MRVGRLNCVAPRVAEHFERALRGQGVTAIRRQKIYGQKERVNGHGATVADVADLEKNPQKSIVLNDIAGGKIQ